MGRSDLPRPVCQTDVNDFVCITDRASYPGAQAEGWPTKTVEVQWNFFRFLPFTF